MGDGTYSDFLHTSVADQPLEVVMRAPTMVLNGVTQGAASALESLDISSVFDLAHSRIFNNARGLVFLSDNGASTPAPRMVPTDVVNATVDTNGQAVDWATQGVATLRGIGRSHEGALKEHLSVETIRDLALWPPFTAARRIVGFVDHEKTSYSDDGVPQELVPKFDEYAAEKAFYSIYVVDEGTARPRKELISAIALDRQAHLESAAVPRRGAILRFEQSWTSLALTLGNLLHSLALGPGESTRIAIIDWTRRQGVKTTEDISSLEVLANSLMQARSISEVTRAVAREAQRGFSSTHSNSTVSNNAYSSYGLQNSDEAFAAVASGVPPAPGQGPREEELRAPASAR
jgi:hypothetical protein